MIDFCVTEALVHRGREKQAEANARAQHDAEAEQFKASHKDFNPELPAPDGG